MKTSTEQPVVDSVTANNRKRNNRWCTESGRASIRTILVPSDMSEESLRALSFVLPVVERFEAKVKLLHVIDPSLYYTADVPYAYIQELGATAELSARLKALASSVFTPEQIGGIFVEIGVPYETIDTVAEREEADLIVLTTHSLKGWRHFLFGSTAETISRYAPCPVLILPKN